MKHLTPIALTLLLITPLLAATPPTLDVTTAGVRPDGKTVNTHTLQQAIDTLAKQGGGILRFPPGQYVTGTLELQSNITLHLDKNATLLGNTDPADYRNLDPFTDGSGNPMGYALLVARDAHHISLEGEGTIDGRGPALAHREKKFTMRPFLIRFVRCTNLSLKDLHLQDPGAWTLHFAQSQNATVDHLTIRTRTTRLKNNDGIDIDSSRNIQVRHCDINSEDDAIVLKATSPDPTTDVQVSDCTLSSHTNAIKLGTESYGGFANISIANCHVVDTDMAGIALYEVDGATLQHVNISNVSIDGVQVPISIRLGARLKTFRPGETPKHASTLQDVTIKGVTAKHVKLIGMLINGIPNHPIQNLTLRNINLTLPGGGTAEQAQKQLPEKEAAYPEYNMFGRTMPAYGIYARHVDGLTLENIHLHAEKPDARPATAFIDVAHLTPPDFAANIKEN